MLHPTSVLCSFAWKRTGEAKTVFFIIQVLVMQDQKARHVRCSKQLFANKGNVYCWALVLLEYGPRQEFSWKKWRETKSKISWLKSKCCISLGQGSNRRIPVSLLSATFFLLKWERLNYFISILFLCLYFVNHILS